MSKSGRNITIGLGIASILSGVYWIYNSGELLEIIPPFIIGIGIIGMALSGTKKHDTDLK